MSGYEAVVPVRWSDQDINGHINNAKVVTLIEEARIEWLNRAAAAEGLHSFDVPKVVVSLNVEFGASISAGSDVDVRVMTERIGRTSFTLRYEGSQTGSEKFSARTTLVVLEPETGLPRPLSEAERDYLLPSSDERIASAPSS